MNDDFQNEIDQALLDRLIDGELSQQELQSLLSSLDDEPGGWRCCALAFLEAQAWQSDLATLQTVSRSPTTTKPAVPTAGMTRTSLRLPVLWLTVAASLLLAFGLGAIAQRQLWSVDPDPVAAPIADRNNENTKKDDLNPSTFHKPIVQPSGRMTLVVGNDDSGIQEIELPVYEAEKLDDGWMKPPELPPEFLQALQRSGHEVRRSQKYLPFNMEDGRSVVVPIEQIDIVPVSRKYQ